MATTTPPAPDRSPTPPPPPASAVRPRHGDRPARALRPGPRAGRCPGRRLSWSALSWSALCSVGAVLGFATDEHSSGRAPRQAAGPGTAASLGGARGRPTGGSATTGAGRPVDGRAADAGATARLERHPPRGRVRLPPPRPRHRHHIAFGVAVNRTAGGAVRTRVEASIAPRRPARSCSGRGRPGRPARPGSGTLPQARGSRRVVRRGICRAA